MEITASGEIFESVRDPQTRSCAFPDVCVMPSGRWIASCRAAPAKADATGQHVLLSWSDDEGRSWSSPASPFIPPRVDSRPGLFRSAYLTRITDDRVLAALFWVDHSSPELPFFNAETEGLLDTRIFISESDDGGESWSGLRMMDTSPFDVPVALTGPILMLPGGELACQFELNKHYYDKSEWVHSAVFMFSRDGGITWPEHSITAKDPENRIFYWDQRPGMLDDGRLLNLFWTYDRRKAQYLNIHARESADGGRVWSEIWDTGVAVQPARPVSMQDGRIVMVYVDRAGAPAIKARSSIDSGRTFPEHTECVIYELESGKQTSKQYSLKGSWDEMEKFSLGLPVAERIADSEILVLFYAGPHPDKTDIRWVRINI